MILPLRMLEIQHRVMGIINPPTVVLSIICSPSDVSLPSLINPTHGHTLPLFSPQQKKIQTVLFPILIDLIACSQFEKSE